MAASTPKGRGHCPVCNSARARFGITSKGLLCCTCDACNCQVFARSDRSDELMQARIVAEPAAPIAAPAAPAPAAPAPAAPVPKRAPSWGMLGMLGAS